MDYCEDCGASRVEGWLIIEGRCVECGPEGFEARRDELQKQARELTALGEAA